MARAQRDGLLLIFLSAVGYAFFPVLVKNIYRTGVEALDLAIWRFVIATVAIWILMGMRRAMTPGLSAHHEKLPVLKLLGLGVIFSMAGLTAFFGLQTNIAASAYVVLFFTHPTMVVVFGVFMGERLPLYGWGAVLLTMVGVMLTAPDFTQGLADSSVLGALLSLANAVIIAVYVILNERILRGYTAMARGSAWVVSGTLITIGGIVLVRGVNLPPNPEAWLYLLGLGVFSTALPIFFLVSAINLLGASRAALASTIEPFMAVLMAVWLLSETLLPLQILGGALILASVLIIEVPQAMEARGARELATPVGD